MKNSFLRMSLVIAGVAFSVAAFSTPASAQFYWGGKVIAFFPNSSEDGLKDFDTGGGPGFFAGYRFMSYFGLEAGAGYYKSESFESNFEGSAHDATREVIAVPLTLTAKSFLPLGGKARIYAGAGVGMYLAVAESRLEDATGSSFYRDDQSAFGFHAVLGGEFMVFSAVGLQVEGKWFKAEPEFSSDHVLNTAEKKTDIGGVMLSLGVLFQL